MHPIFQGYANYKKSTKNARVLAENKVAPVSGHGLHLLFYNAVCLEPYFTRSLIRLWQMKRSKNRYCHQNCQITHRMLY